MLKQTTLDAPRSHLAATGCVLAFTVIIGIVAGLHAPFSTPEGVRPAAGHLARHNSTDHPLAQPWMNERERHALTTIEALTFQSLPGWAQRRILETDAAVAERIAPSGIAGSIAHPIDESQYAQVADLVSRENFARLSPAHREMMIALRDVPAAQRPAFCFAPGTDPLVVEAFEAIFGGDGPLAFQQTARWSSTATNGGGLTQGDPTTLTYSFAPDGTTIPSFNLGPEEDSTLFAFFDGIYGDTATWQNLFHDVFDRWEELSGLTLIHELNDDGAAFSDIASAAPGVLGVRGDVRIGGRAIDGDFGVLAFNFFPNNGEMILDTTDSFYNTTTNNSIRLRNVVAHEHGHGNGQRHVCPANGTKLMEPFLTTGFDGPQFDDILNVQRHYGDRFEHNDTVAAAIDLGTLTFGVPVFLDELSIDDNDDVDYFAVTVPATSILIVNVSPLGFSYLEGPQNINGSCSAGTTFDPSAFSNLALRVFDTDGVTVLLDRDDNPIGEPESLAAALPAAGTYFIEVDAGDENTIQAYDLTVEAIDEGVVISAVNPPTSFPRGQEASFAVEALALEATSNPLLHYRYDGGPFLTTPLVPSGPAGAEQFFTATLPPADCDDLPEFFVSIDGDSSGTVTDPPAGDTSPFTARVGEFVDVVAEGFESGLGDFTTSGLWHLTSACSPDGACEGSTFAYYGQDGTCNYDTGVTNAGSLTLSMTLPELAAPEDTIVLRYCSLLQTENFSGFDNAELLVNGNPLIPQHTESLLWQTIEVDLSSFAGQTVTIEWSFDTADNQFNTFLGWFIDDVRISAFDCIEPCVGDVEGVSPGIVDIQDLLAVLGAWGPCPDPCPPACPEDVINDDCLVDINDLLAVLGAWGPCP